MNTSVCVHCLNEHLLAGAEFAFAGPCIKAEAFAGVLARETDLLLRRLDQLKGLGRPRITRPI